MIPKIIHYCWFGRNEKSKLAQKCIKSWKNYCPEYEIIEWNEDNFDLNQHPYLRWCYDNKKWAFLSDFARLIIIKEYGGIYFDTDVEVVKTLNPLLKYDAFYGFENDRNINTGHGFGAIANHPSVLLMLEQYDKLIPDKNGEYPLIPCPALNTNGLIPYGLVLDGKRQSLNGIEVFPVDFFNPYDDPTGVLKKTKNTYSIHWYSKSWIGKAAILRSKLTKPFHRLFGEDCFKRLKHEK